MSESWLQQYVKDYYAAVPQQVEGQPKPQQRLDVQMDKLWSLVANSIIFYNDEDAKIQEQNQKYLLSGG